MATTETRRAIDLKLYIGGEWTEGTGDGAIEIKSPATGEHLANLPKASKEDVRRAAEAAREAQREWRNVGPWQRAEVCHRIGGVRLDFEPDAVTRLRLPQGSHFAP